VQGQQFARITHQVVSADTDAYFNLALSDIAQGLRAKVLADLTGQYTASATGNTATVTGRTAFTAVVRQGNATIASAEAAFTDARIMPTANGANTTAGQSWTLTLNGVNYLYTAGSSPVGAGAPDALTLNMVVTRLAAMANGNSGFTVTADTTGTPFLRVVNANPFTARMTQSAVGTSATIGTTPGVAVSATKFGAVNVQATGPVTAGTTWIITLNGVDFRYIAGLNGEMTVLPSLDVTITDKDAPGVLVTQTDGSTRVTEPTDLVFLGQGQVTGNTANSGYALTLNSSVALAVEMTVEDAPNDPTASLGKATFSGTQVWTSANFTIDGTVSSGNVWTLRLEGVDYSYTAGSIPIGSSTPDALTLNAVALGLKGKLPPGIYTTSVANNVLTVSTSNTAGFTAKVLASNAAISGSSAFRNPTVAFSGTVDAGETWTLKLNGASYSYVTGSGGAALTLNALANGLRNKLIDTVANGGAGYAAGAVVLQTLTQFAADFGAASLNEADDPRHGQRADRLLQVQRFVGNDHCGRRRGHRRNVRHRPRLRVLRPHRLGQQAQSVQGRRHADCVGAGLLEPERCIAGRRRQLHVARRLPALHLHGRRRLLRRGH